jgi:hypothetical protein
MPRSITEVKALRKLNRAVSEHQTPPHDPQGRHGFDPNQPRVPPGHSDGGQWTDEAAAGASSAPRREVTFDHTGTETWSSFASAYRPDGSLVEQRVFNRDGSTIVSEFKEPGGPGDWDERHTVITADGHKATFEIAGDVQRIYDENGQQISASVWTKDGPEALPMVQQAFLAAIPPAVTTSIELALILLAWLASRDGPDRTAVLSLPTAKYQLGPAGKLERIWVGQLTDEQVKAACPKYPTVRKETDNAAKTTNRNDYRSAAEYGTVVHTKLAEAIGKNDPNFRPEVSFLKTLDETGKVPDKTSYGTKGSVRIDVLENTNSGRVCVYDIKTGKSGLSPSRIAEIAQAVYLRYPEAPSFLVMEVRPRSVGTR